MNHAIVILLESDRIYFHDQMIFLLTRFIYRMRLFGSETLRDPVLNLYYCEKLFSEVLKQISRIDLISAQVSKVIILMIRI